MKNNGNNRKKKISDVSLEKLNLPRDLKDLNYDQCEKLCSDIRKTLIETVSNNGGHLSSNLGTVELTLALHRVFKSPDDKIIFDVGHQAYTHKILTGRYKEFSTLRKKDGISGFCKPCESKHDPVITGHSSTAVSSAFGIASAMKINGSNNYAVAVVGDGAFTGGMAYEGLNNAGKSDVNLIVILNINEMSISKNVGGMAKYLSNLRYKDGYIKTKDVVEKTLNKVPVIGSPIKNTLRSSKNAFKNFVLSTTIFEELGFDFVGPVDGHDQKDLEEGLRAAKSKKRPVVVAVNTVKGKGYAPAEENPGEYHGVGSFEIETGNPDIVSADSFSSAFGNELVKLAEKDDRICAVTAAMKYGTGLQHFAKAYPERFFDVGIAEEHAATFCGGLAVMGKIPVFAVYSTFVQRCYDQIIHDLSISNTHTVFGIDRAGIVGDDGETHNGIFDIPMITSVPNTKIYSPSDYEELRCCLYNAINNDDGIVAVRYPRGNSKVTNNSPRTDYYYENNNSNCLVVTYGRLYNNVSEAVSEINYGENKVDLLKIVNVFPISDEIKDIISKYENVLFFEESYYDGSISQKISAEFDNVKSFTINGFVKQMSICEAYEQLGFSIDKIIQTIKEHL
ncbi:MAG: 1-deoxy-D-xylulose-5-phosphate synthase [Ruminococcus sp.]|nr:1-deoxy-D-xylulose-5-phosphate synthase [Ruminococcus sp.]